MSFLYGLFDWKLVSPERHLQLLRATEAQAKLADLPYQDIQQRYRAMRRALFIFLNTCVGIDVLLEWYMDVALHVLDDESALALAALLD